MELSGIIHVEKKPNTLLTKKIIPMSGRGDNNKSGSSGSAQVCSRPRRECRRGESLVGEPHLAS